jgi:hypothetical protein
MKVYIPATMSTLARLMSSQQVDAHVAYGVTEQARQTSDSVGEEAIEKGCLASAASYALRALSMLASSEPPRRVVIVAEVSEDVVRSRRELPGIASVYPVPYLVRVDCPVPLSKVVAVYLDDPDAEADLAAGMDAIGWSDLGSGTALMRVGAAESREPHRHSVEEIPGLVQDL